ncbi:MAG: hypothetical protein HQ481_15610 [Alphaproteobacteria bacterium]|nr:hypothetical protein [Alphaproteobacteria bacterium]
MAQSLFEVHTLKGGQWVIDSTYPERDAAIDVAKQLYGEKAFEAIKVIKDTYDSKTGQGKEMVIYDSAKAPKPKAPPPTAKDEASAAKPVAGAPGTGAHKKKPANKDVSVALKAAGWLVVILVGGLGVLFLLTKAGDLFNKGF